MRSWRCAMLLLCAGCERASDTTGRLGAACETQPDTAQLARVARDTVARLRARPQLVTRIAPVRTGGLELRTEDSSPGALHDGGLVTFDCAGRVTLVWLDGG